MLQPELSLHGWKTGGTNSSQTPVPLQITVQSLLALMTYCPPQPCRFPVWKTSLYGLEAACAERPRCSYHLLNVTRCVNPGPHGPTSTDRCSTPIAKRTFSPRSIIRAHQSSSPTSHGESFGDAPWALLGHEGVSAANHPRKAAKPQQTRPGLLGGAAGRSRKRARSCSQPPSPPPPPTHPLRQRSAAQPARTAPAAA